MILLIKFNKKECKKNKLYNMYNENGARMLKKNNEFLCCCNRFFIIVPRFFKSYVEFFKLYMRIYFSYNWFPEFDAGFSLLANGYSKVSPGNETYTSGLLNIAIGFSVLHSGLLYSHIVF